MRFLVAASFAIWALAIPMVLLANEDRTLGFELGSSLEQAQDYAHSRGWELMQTASRTHNSHWSVIGAEATIVFCKNKLFSVDRRYIGGVEEFVSLEARIRREILNGLPETDIQQISLDGNRVSLVDANFLAKDGSHTVVRLRSNDGKVDVLTMTWLAEVCS